MRTFDSAAHEANASSARAPGARGDVAGAGPSARTAGQVDARARIGQHWSVRSCVPPRARIDAAWRRLRRDRISMAGLIGFGLIVLFALAADLIARSDGTQLLARGAARSVSAAVQPRSPSGYRRQRSRRAGAGRLRRAHLAGGGHPGFRRVAGDRGRGRRGVRLFRRVRRCGR